jgi:hypothetical protein
LKNEFKRGYKLRNNLVKNENGDLLADSRNILDKPKSYFSQLQNAHNVSDVRQTEVQIAIAKLKKYDSPGHDQFWQK